jgi:hypothetical protein
MGQPFVAAMATQYLGQAALFSGDLSADDRLLRQAAERYRGVADRHEALCWADIGVVATSGAALDGRQAVGLALGEPHEIESPGDAREAPTDNVLTRRQRQVARLVARGPHRPGDRHAAGDLAEDGGVACVEQIRTRLGVGSRAEVAAWFARRA